MSRYLTKEKIKAPQYGKLFIRRNSNGFGYEVIQKNKKYRIAKVIYSSSSLEQIEQQVIPMLKAGANVSKLPAPMTDFKPRLLVYMDNGNEIYYLLKNQADFYNTFFNILKKKYEAGLYQWMKNYKLKTVENIFAGTWLSFLAYENRIKNKNKEFKKTYDRIKTIYGKISYALQSGIISKAYGVMQDLRKEGYEDFSLEDFADVNENSLK